VPDLDLRLVRYFTVVAEHEHFGRAAEALHVAQPSLSRQIHRLEELVGARLLDRTPQGSRLTPAGRAFLTRAEGLLHDADLAARAARGAARSEELVVGFTTGLVVTPAVRELRHRHPDATVTTRHVGWGEVATALPEHRVDVVVGRMTYDVEGVEVEVLYEEPRVLVVPLDHRLAGKESVTLDDFADEPMVGVEDPRADAFWRVLPRPDGRTPPPGPVVTHLEDKFELVAEGSALTLVPESSGGAGLRPDLTAVPVVGVAPLRVGVATRVGEDSPLLRAFRAAARSHLTPGATTQEGTR
jgi:DNA-binding transcriptional LysR family regulator